MVDRAAPCFAYKMMPSTRGRSERDVYPYNRTTKAQACTLDLLLLPHTAQVRIDETGTAIVRVIGEQRGASTGNSLGPAETHKIHCGPMSSLGNFALASCSAIQSRRVRVAPSLPLAAGLSTVAM